MTREEAKAALTEAAAAINLCATILRPHVEFFSRYENERRHMENFGHIVDPTLFRDSERRAADAIMAPLFRGAQEFLHTIDLQVAAAKGALEKVR